MEDPLPTPTDSARANLLKMPSGGSGERLSAFVPPESGLAKSSVEPPATAPIEKRMSSLATALRRARVENAEYSSARADLRGAEIVRLEMLADALVPVLAQVPKDCDIFDVAVSPGERPRLFIDHIGFVEMDRDRRTYRFLQDTRHGRIKLRETADMDEIVDAVTDYIAHRLIEREKALAIDYASGGAARVVRNLPVIAKKPTKAASKAFQAFLFLIELLGSATFFGLLAVIAVWVYRTYFAA